MRKKVKERVLARDNLLFYLKRKTQMQESKTGWGLQYIGNKVFKSSPPSQFFQSAVTPKENKSNGYK